MQYLETCTNIIDVTKPPYCADNTGKTDCTAILRQILDDVLVRYVNETENFATQLRELSEDGKYDVYVGFESGRMVDGVLRITFPDNEPTPKIIYFPAGTYLVSDTVCYTLTNLKNKYYACPDYDLNRNIHILGESMENTVIRLADNAPGFEAGSIKPLLSFNTTVAPRDVEVSNVSQMNMLENLTLDMGNNGGVGVRYHSSNNGRIENVTVKAQRGTAGIYTVQGSEATFSNITVSGCDYGMDIAYSSLITIDGTDVSGNRIAGMLTNDSSMVILGMDAGSLQAVEFRDGTDGRYYIIDPTLSLGDPKGNSVYKEEHTPVSRAPFPENRYSSCSDCAFVDDFGAVPDGKTDASRAIQKAFDSGKPVILFGEGEYFINATIRIPATVKYINFNYCSLASGARLIGGECDCAFEIAQADEEPLFVENFYSSEHFYGHMRMLKQSCVRDVVLKNLQPTMACLYFNTVPGSRVFLDNIFLTTGTYSQNRVLVRKNLLPVYSKNIPLEFHGQTVVGKGVNLERADVALLNDGSEVLIDGFRTEGPGTAAKTVNGGKTVINIFDAGIGSKWAENPLFEAENAAMYLTGIRPYGYNKDSEYNILVKDTQGDTQTVICWDDADTQRKPFLAILHSYGQR